MKKIPIPLFQDKLTNINWKKIYAREYGVQYSEMALLCLSPKADYHIPKPSTDQLIIPDGNNTVFYIDELSWKQLVNSLNQEYTLHSNKLEDYESKFILDGNNYVSTAQKISKLHFSSLSNQELKNYYRMYQDTLFTYSVFAWTSFILNNYVAERATNIIETYIKQHTLQEKKQEIIDSLFHPSKRAAILELQHEVEERGSNLTNPEFTKLYEKYKWLSCLDLHNKPWTREQFKETITSFKKVQRKEVASFESIGKDLQITKEDLEYLLIAKRFVYIKDARDDFRRKGVYLALPFFAELAKRMKINSEDISYVLSSEIIQFLSGKIKIYPQLITERKNGFMMYLDYKLRPVCIQNAIEITNMLQSFHLQKTDDYSTIVKGNIACNGMAKGSVSIVHGVKDLQKVTVGSILVAVTTHPDYTVAMRKAAAIVTDEGGITSHAAIVSREYNIPCIVGTHNATKILKDGDYVEVNANDGLVKKVSNV